MEMIMNTSDSDKVRVGTKVLMVHPITGRDHTLVGKVLTVKSKDVYGVYFEGGGSGCWHQIELYPDDDKVLTVQELIEALASSTNVQMYTDGIGWLVNQNPTWNQILFGKFRIKPSTEYIDYYGQCMPKPVANAEELDCLLWRVEFDAKCVIKSKSFGCYRSNDGMYFRTEADAQEALSILTKPFVECTEY